jgi:hypothetical protein
LVQAVAIPDIERIIQTKWESVGYPSFVLSCLFHTFLTFCMTMILAFLNTVQHPKQRHYHPRLAAVILNGIVGYFFTLMLEYDAMHLCKFGWKQTSYRGVALYHKILRIVKTLAYAGFYYIFLNSSDYRDAAPVIPTSQPTSAPTSAPTSVPLLDVTSANDLNWHREKMDQGMKACLVICVAACYLHQFYFFMGFARAGPFVLTLYRIISQDVPYFIQFYCLIVFATACALSVLKNDLYNASGGFILLCDIAYKLVQDIVGLELTHYSVTNLGDYPRHLRWIVNIVLTLYRIVVTILMLNLLIAMISNTYAAYCEYSATLLLIEKYNIMDAMESVMWPQELQRIRSKYTRIKTQEELNIQRAGAYNDEKESPAGYFRAQYLRHGAIVVAKVAPLIAKPIAAVRRMSALLKPAKIVVEALPSADAVHEVPGMGSDPLAVCAEAPYDSTLSVQQHVHTRYLFELPTVHNAGHNKPSRERDPRSIADPIATRESDNSTDGTTNRSSKTALFLVDPQADFYPGGAMSVVASAEVSERIGECFHGMLFVYDCAVLLSVQSQSHPPSSRFKHTKRSICSSRPQRR